jgi:hypothetical protein
MHGNLFIKPSKAMSLRDFAELTFAQLDVSSIETRNSANYVNEEYVTGRALGLSVKISIADDAEFEGYDFLLNLRPIGVSIPDRTALDGLADIIARQLALNKNTVLRPLDYGRQGAGSVVYGNH